MFDQPQAQNMERYVLDHFDAAMEHGYIKVYCQPVVRALSRALCGMEALARWEDPEAGLLMPDKFIPVLEEHRRIHELDSYIIRRVCEGYHLLEEGGAFVPVSINLSRLDYELCDIFQVVEKAVAAHRMPRSHLCIEITESTLNNNEQLMRQYIDRFRRAGYPVWMDDFGSGYSSLNLLKDFEFDELKIDMKFLSDFHARSKSILASIVNMAKRIGIQTLTEGVETEEEFEFLRNIGCEKMQGSLFGAPMPYLDCLRHAQARGLAWEPPTHRAFYDAFGRVNLLSSGPFVGTEAPKTGRELNALPLALVELRGDEAKLLLTNDAFDAMAADMDFRVLFGESALTADAALRQLSVQLRRLLEEARSGAGKGRLHLVYGGDYYEFRTLRLARQENLCGILLRMDNLSRGSDLTRQKALDEGLRQIYSIYNWVSLLDLRAGTITPLHLDAREQIVPLTGDLNSIRAEYAFSRLLPEDRDRFLRFSDPDTLDARVLASGTGAISVHLRSRTYHGNYIWKCYTMLRLRESVYYMLVRDAETEIREILHGSDSEERRDALTPELLWANFVQYSPVKFFWKDRERRFRGASQSFLDFYGFNSRQRILGKTDEDMGWHIHPDTYRDCEEDVIGEGAMSYDVPGTCIARGESRNILASKLPLYDKMGNIVGLFGYFSESAMMDEQTERLKRNARLDTLTGLLNSRGLDEDFYAYRDEYELRHTDFARIDVALEDLPEINRNYGYEFGDSVIREVAAALLRHCGSAATVGRLTGSQFTVLCQFETRDQLDALADRLRNISNELCEVNGIPFTTYLSVGVSVFSEAGSMDEMVAQTQLRRLTDDAQNTSPIRWRYSASRVFRMYEVLPLGYSVYKVLTNKEGADLLILYTNNRFARMLGVQPGALVGERVSRAFPAMNQTVRRMAYRAALDGEESCARIYSEIIQADVAVTASRVIGKGYCALTYQTLDKPDCLETGCRE